MRRASVRRRLFRWRAGSRAGCRPPDQSRRLGECCRTCRRSMLSKREPIRQAVFGGGPLRQRHSRRLNVDPGDGQLRLPLQQQQPQQAGAAAQIADPQSGGAAAAGRTSRKESVPGRNSVSSQTNRSPSGFRYSQCSTPSPPIERFYYYIGEPLSPQVPAANKKTVSGSGLRRFYVSL